MASEARSLSRPRLFLDTWAWLALADRNDPWHEIAVETFLAFKNDLQATTDYVLDETITHLFMRLPFAHAQQFVDQIWTSQQQGRVVVVRVTEAVFQSAWRNRLRFRDKPDISFTDLTSFAVIEDWRIPYVLTGDAHFTQVGLQCKVLPG
jgi:predicted nucleic acid-binding protein